MTILTITNHHPDIPTPDFGDLTGKFVQYYENKYGEQYVFVGERSENGDTATLWAGDAGWKKFELTRNSMYPEMVMHREEHMWIMLCWASLAHEEFDKIEFDYSVHQSRTMRQIFHKLETEKTPEQIDRAFLKSLPVKLRKAVAEDMGA